MTIEHHVSEDLLVAYGAGTLAEAPALLVATHLALCPDCRADLDLAETLGGAWVDRDLTGEPADEGLPDAAIRSADADRGDRRPSGPAASAGGGFVLPQPLRDYAGGDAAALRWRAVGGGIRQVPLPMPPGGATARLLWIPAGEGVPEHGHHGSEATLVLAGAFYDRNVWYRRGDVEIVDADVVHRPVAGPEEACICLAVTEAPLRFRALIPRLVGWWHHI